eukprot:jgi/Botrbrau1/18273/Bobra.0179s0007.1
MSKAWMRRARVRAAVGAPSQGHDALLAQHANGPERSSPVGPQPPGRPG